MAPTKATSKSAVSADALADDMLKMFGGHDEASSVKIWLDTGYPELNNALSSRWDGGLAVGRMIEIAGPPSSGKTAIATQAMVCAQKAGGFAMFLDHERSFEFPLAEKFGLDTRLGRFLYKKPMTFEESLSLCIGVAKHIRAKKLIPATAPICAVFDSLAHMVPQSVMYDKDGKERSMEDRNMNDNTALARATSAHFPAFEIWCDELDICAIFLNQIRTDMKVVYGDNRKTTGGNAPGFAFSQRLWLRASKFKTSKDADVAGTIVTGDVVKNKAARPFLSAVWKFVYQPDGTGKFDFILSTLEFLIREKILEKKTTGRIPWDGNDVFPADLVRKLEADPAGWDKLKALLPKAYEAPIVMEIPADEDVGLEEAA